MVWPEYLRLVTAGLTPTEIAARAGMSLSTVTRWLSGETKPSEANLERLAKTFPLKVDEARALLATFEPTAKVRNTLIRYSLEGQLLDRKALLRMYSDLELASEIVRRIEQHDSVEVARPFPEEGNVIDFPLSSDVTPTIEYLRSDDRAAAKPKSRDRGEEPEAP